MNWLPVQGYEGLYEINENGDVRSLHKRNFHQLLSQRIDRAGYLTVRLSTGGKDITCYIHRLLAKAFIENPENKPFINHKNGIKTDNRILNLEWCTQSENIKHAYETGLIKERKEKPVIDIITGIWVPSVRIASKFFRIDYSTLKNYLNGNRPNPTFLRYAA